MAFEDLREQLRERVAEAMSKIQENSTFNTLRERYESQTPPVQQAINLGAGAAALLLLLSFPMSYISSSSDSLAQFEENRQLIQGLLRASRSAKEPAPLPPPMSAEILRGSLEASLRQVGLLPDQIGEMNPIPDAETKGLAPPGVVTTGLAAQIKKLNVAQVVEIANAIQNIAPGIKLFGVDVVQSAGTTHYYDLTLQVMNFGLPAFDQGEDAGAPGKKGAAKPKGQKSDVEAE